FNVKHVLIPPAGRAEFIVTTPSAKVKSATLQALKVNVGALGQNNIARPLATLRKTSPPAVVASSQNESEGVGPQRFAEIEKAVVTARRTLYFSQEPKDPNDPGGPNNFFITVA